MDDAFIALDFWFNMKSTLNLTWSTVTSVWRMGELYILYNAYLLVAELMGLWVDA